MLGSQVEKIWSADELLFRPGEELAVRPNDDGYFWGNIDSRPPLGAVRRVERGSKTEKLVALTFDLCEAPNEQAGYDGRIVDYLRCEDVRATFFACGKWMSSHRKRSKQLMADSRFEIGSHTWDHANLAIASPSTIAHQLDADHCIYCDLRAELIGDLNNAKAEVTLPPERMRAFRFPYGRYNDIALRAVASRGMHSIQWDVVTGDPDKSRTSSDISQEVLSSTQNGSIVIFHANGRGWNTAVAIPDVVRGLRQQGFSFVTISELLASGEPQFFQTCFEKTPGDNEIYDSYGSR